MNNGLSNGHDLNLDFGTSISPLNSPSSFPTTELATNKTNQNIIINSGGVGGTGDTTVTGTTTTTMGVLSATTNNNNNNNNDMKAVGDPSKFLSSNFFLFNGNNIESLILDPDTQWTASLKTNFIDNNNKVDTLPQINATTSTTTAMITTTTTTLSNHNKTINNYNNNDNNMVSSDTLNNIKNNNYNNRLNVSKSFLVKNANLPDGFNLVQKCDEKHMLIQHPQNFNKFDDMNLNNKFLIKEESSSDGTMIAVTSSSSSKNYQNDMFMFPSTTTMVNSVSDLVPKEESICNDLLLEQQILHKQCNEMKRRIRRLQVQYTHKNLVKQMKQFVSQQQKLNSTSCQRFELDFSQIINEYSDSFLQQIDNNKLIKSDQTDFNNSFHELSGTFLQQQCSSSNHTLNSSLNVDSQKQQNLLSSNFLLSNNNNNQFDLSYLHNVSSNDWQNTNNSFVQDKSNVLTVPQRTTMSQENQNKLLTTIDSLRYNLRHLEYKYDSDATDSSSGGESCDEFDDNDHIDSTYSLPLLSSTSTSKSKSIRNHLSWKWCNERNAIASRWSWLQANIADLETRLRQQNDVYRHIKANKGYIQFGENDIVLRQFPSFSTSTNHQCSTGNAVNSNQQAQGSSLSFGNNSNSSICSINSSNINNVNNTPESVKDQQEQPQENPEEERHCMRTMPFINMKRRKLLWAENNLAVAIKKAVKYSSIQCSCNIHAPYVPPCVICNGRYSYMHSIDTEFMPFYERVSLLDSSCHPTLCLPNDVPLGLHFTHFLKREIFNNNKLPAITRNKKKKVQHSTSNIPSNDQKSGKKLPPHPTTLKSKKKLLKNKKRRLSSESTRKNQRDRLSSGCSSRAESPVPSPSASDASSTGASVSTPTNSTTSAPLNRRRRSEQHAFDINNIVIPYCIAATTRVERLQYKEIITPKWRLIEEYSIPPPENVKREILNNNTNAKHSANSNEDVSDNAFQVRHSKCEMLERQRILTYYGNQKNQNARKGSRVRFESKSDSLEQSMQDSCSNSSSSSKIKSKVKAHNNDYERKRQTSLSKSLSRDEHVSFEEEEAVAPYELRKFPLQDWLYEKMVQETNIQQQEDEERRQRRSAAAAKLSSMMVDDDFDSLDEPTTSSRNVSPTNLTDVEMNDNAQLTTHYYHHDDDGDVFIQEQNDPEWTPQKSP